MMRIERSPLSVGFDETGGAKRIGFGLSVAERLKRMFKFDVNR